MPSDDPLRDWTFTPDLAPALARLAALPPAERPVHLCSPHVLRDSAMAGRIAALVPGAVCVTEPAAAPAKPPMRSSDLSRLGAVRWTNPDAALARLTAAEVTA